MKDPADQIIANLVRETRPRPLVFWRFLVFGKIFYKLADLFKAIREPELIFGILTACPGVTHFFLYNEEEVTEYGDEAIVFALPLLVGIWCLNYVFFIFRGRHRENAEPLVLELPRHWTVAISVFLKLIFVDLQIYIDFEVMMTLELE